MNIAGVIGVLRMGGWAFWGAVAVIVAGMWAFAFWMRRRRKAALRVTAGELNLDFQPKGSRALTQRLAGFDLHAQFRDFGNMPVQNLMHRVSGDQEITIFDYRCRSQHSSDSPTLMTVLLLEWPELDLPKFCARPESLFRKLGNALGQQDIDFSGYPLFSRKYVLTGENENDIRTTMTDTVIRAFEEHTDMGISGISVEGSGNRLLVYYFRRTVPAAKLPEFLAAALDVAEPLAKAR